jgi:hypothetical protein
MTLSPKKREALHMLAGAEDGCTVPSLLARGADLGALNSLVVENFATAHSESLPHRRKMRFVMRLWITDAGRRALATPE